MNYKKSIIKKQFKQSIFASLGVLEELLDFDPYVFNQLIETFATSYESDNLIKCNLILYREIIPFFQSSRQIFEQYHLDVDYFIDVFSENKILDHFLQIILENNHYLLEPSILLLSLLSSLHEAFCKYISSFPDFINTLSFFILDFEDELFENSIILFNNSLQFICEEIDPDFIGEFLDKFQNSEIDTNIIQNIFINMIQYANVLISAFPFIINIIIKGMSESYFLDSMNLIYHCYQNELNQKFLIEYLPDILQKLIPISFTNIDCLLIYFRILIDVLNFDTDNQNLFKNLIFENIPIETLKNALNTNDFRVIQSLFSFLSICPKTIIIQFSLECFDKNETCVQFIIKCILDCEHKLKKSAIHFLSIYIKEIFSDTKYSHKNANLLNFLVDEDFIDILSKFIQTDDTEVQKLALNFLNAIIELDFYSDTYFPQLFEYFQEEEVIEIIEELSISSTDDDIANLAESVMRHYTYLMNKSDDIFVEISELSRYA